MYYVRCNFSMKGVFPPQRPMVIVVIFIIIIKNINIIIIIISFRMEMSHIKTMIICRNNF